MPKGADLSGRIGQAPRAQHLPRAGSSSGGGGVISSHSLPGGYSENTLDEPISATILRDLKKVWHKTVQVLVPKGRENALKEWDLWGPMLMCLSLAIIMSSLAPEKQASTVFTGVFVIVCFGSSVVTLNCKLLGGNV
ncbi:hypothetical protein EV182_002690 [Spiromyces aspiralis]|uniref:Uncharacterized protein n=1 Tax=Spiromyces aspiralis TaxID=68401 RepID=A0ACC1HH84_9FUNG|nr:hypothetical protein EV182_002690 [Spiromyces aspiralis]